MSGVQQADVMSIDSGPESEFKFQDFDKEGNPTGKDKKRSGSQFRPNKSGLPRAPAFERPRTQIPGFDPDAIIGGLENIDEVATPDIECSISESP